MAFRLPGPGFAPFVDPTIAHTPKPTFRPAYAPSFAGSYRTRPLPWSPGTMASFLNSQLGSGSGTPSPLTHEQLGRLTGARGARFHAQVVAKLEAHIAPRSLPSRALAQLAAVGQRLAPQIARVATNPYVLGAVGLAVVGALAYYWWTHKSPAIGKVVEEQAELIGVPASAIYEFAKFKTPHYHMERPNLPMGFLPGEKLPNY